MGALLVVLHILVCFALVVVVLVQTGKGAEIGATFGGGGSHTLFGSRGAGNFLTKATAVVGTVFMLTSLALALMSSNVTGGSVVEELPAAPPAQTEAMPAEPQGEPFATMPQTDEAPAAPAAPGAQEQAAE